MHRHRLFAWNRNPGVALSRLNGLGSPLAPPDDPAVARSVSQGRPFFIASLCHLKTCFFGYCQEYAVQSALRNEAVEDHEAAVGVGIVLDHEARVLAFGQPSGETSPREFADGDLDRYHSGSPLTFGHPIPLVG